MTETFSAAPSLAAWCDANQPDENLIWKSGVAQQRDIFHDLWLMLQPQHSMSEWREACAWRDEHPVTVVSTHRSKSVVLPVVRIPGAHCVLYIRGNFFNFVVSVVSERPLEDTFMELMADRDEVVPDIYAEGFSQAWLYGSYSQDHAHFTTYVPYNTHALWAFGWLLAKQVR